MNTKKKYKIGIERFHELMLKAESQGLAALFTDSDVYNVLFDMWPEDADQLEEGERLILFDTHYSDKTGPSSSNELLDLGTVGEPLCGPIAVEEVGGRIITIEVDKGDGKGKARITFVDKKPAGIKVAPDEPGDKDTGLKPTPNGWVVEKPKRDN